MLNAYGMVPIHVIAILCGMVATNTCHTIACGTNVWHTHLTLWLGIATYIAITLQHVTNLCHTMV